MSGALHRNAGLVGVNLLTLALLLPFVNKPFHIDDPVYLWTAQHIRSAPLDFYGLRVNWYGYETRACDDAHNPPLASYYLALASLVLGWREAAMHTAMLLPALGLVSATYMLARHVGSRPALAAAATILAPVALLSCTTVMCDILMLCFYVWALYFWMRGVDECRIALLVVACAFAALSALSKYFGITLIPLFAAYAAMRTCRPGWWIATLLIPIGILASFEAWTKSKYDRGLIVDAIKYATHWRWNAAGKSTSASTTDPAKPAATETAAATNGSSKSAAQRSAVTKTLTSLAFAGGCCATIAVILLFTSRWPLILAALVSAGAALFTLHQLKPFEHILGGPAVAALPAFRAQMVIDITLAAVLLVALTLIWWRYRDARTTTLLLWIFGAFIFAGFVNWTVAGRSILPMAPPAAILMARAAPALRFKRERWGAFAGLAIGGAVAIAVCCADLSLARATRKAAERFHQRSENYAGRLWFQGHWGFQYYMQQFGFTPIDSRCSQLNYADVVFWPENNTNKVRLPMQYLREIDYIQLPLMQRVSTMDRTAGSGFYSDAWGPLPFAFGPVAPEEYAEFQVMTQIVYRP